MTSRRQSNRKEKRTSRSIRKSGSTLQWSKQHTKRWPRGSTRICLSGPKAANSADKSRTEVTMEESASNALHSRTEEIVLVAELESVEHGGSRGSCGSSGVAGYVEILGRSGEANVFDVAELRQLPVLSLKGKEIVNGESVSRERRGEEESNSDNTTRSCESGEKRTLRGSRE